MELQLVLSLNNLVPMIRLWWFKLNLNASLNTVNINVLCLIYLLNEITY